MLFIVGGLIGLVVLFIYNKGRKDAGAKEPHKRMEDDHQDPK
jgi:hypothetical protein